MTVSNSTDRDKSPNESVSADEPYIYNSLVKEPWAVQLSSGYS